LENTMATTLPTIALVHGAFAESASWNRVIERLQHQDAMPDGGEERPFRDIVAIANPLRSLQGDARYVRDVLEAIDGPIVLVAHSYGGMVITEAAAGLDAVVALVYVGAFAPAPGESAFSLSTMFPGSTLGDALDAHPVSTGGVELVIRPDVFRAQFAADVPAAETTLMAATQRPVTQAALSDPVVADRPAWAETPSWFVFGDADRNIPVQLQRFASERAGARESSEIAGASHAISVSSPAAVASAILRAAAASAPQAVQAP